MRAPLGAQRTVSLKAILERTGDWIASLSTYLAGTALLVIVAINGVNVVGRYFFGAPLSWAEEAMLYLMVFVVFAGGAAVTWRGTHMRLDAIIDRMPMGARRSAIVATAIIGVGVMSAVAAAGFEIVTMLRGFGQVSDALHFPMWIAQSCVPVGFVLFSVLIVLRLIVFGAKPPASEIAEIAENAP